MAHHEGGKYPADEENNENQGDVNGGDGLFKQAVYLFVSRVVAPGDIVGEEKAVVGGPMAGSLLYKVEGVVQRMHILSVAWAPRVLPLAVIGERLDFRKIAAVAVNIYGNRFPGEHDQILLRRQDGNQPFGSIVFREVHIAVEQNVRSNLCRIGAFGHGFHVQMVLPADEEHGTAKEYDRDDEYGENGHEEHGQMGNNEAQAKIHKALLPHNAGTQQFLIITIRQTGTGCKSKKS